MITELEFKSLAQQGYNRIPLIAEAFADLETPLSLYLKLAHARDGGKYSFLLESVVGGERFGRYSFIGLPARTLLRSSGFGADAVTEVVTDGKVVANKYPISDAQKRSSTVSTDALGKWIMASRQSQASTAGNGSEMMSISTNATPGKRWRFAPINSLTISPPT